MTQVGDFVHVPGTPPHYYGQIMEMLSQGRARVHFKAARVPKCKWYCDKCGSPGTTSLVHKTGEIVCSRPGCDGSYGFEEWDEELLVASLDDFSETYRRERREEYLAKLRVDIVKGLEEGHLTEEQASNMLGHL